MEQRILGKTGLSVGVVAFGGIAADRTDGREAAGMVSWAVESGINYFDVAPSYGKAQYMLGPALKPYRKEVFLACKTDRRTAKEARSELEESLRALETDYLDNYQLHGIDSPDEIETVFAPGGAMEVLLDAKKSGVTKNIGFTCHMDSAALELMRRGEFDTMLFPVNFAYREQKGGGVAAAARAAELGMGILAIKALAHRKNRAGEKIEYPKCWYRPIYDDPELARLALNYTLSQNVAAAVAPGDERMLRLAVGIIESQNGKAVPLSEDEYAELRRRAAQTEDVIF
ncbi:MAG: aldo/keto reductase [Firmicutes bacterium]|nr:aldo/keto reductase [Bacillota bacterium]